MKTRCKWAKADSLSKLYHDTEWGVPQHDDRLLFEHIILDGLQAGLSWSIILQKRENIKSAFDNFDPVVIAGYKIQKIEELLADKGVIRNRGKVEAVVQNAQAFLNIQKEFKSFDGYIWQFVKRKPVQNSWKTPKEIPTQTKESIAMSRDLKRRGFKFVGPVMCYAFMQAVGMVNDHTIDCFRYREVQQ
ncbi:MAG: DNA-3-methyladenine glycosylase I [Deltaproteobacteria bacterium]|nr:MAG: DNA-3-methyladenine glycosylase I [Deltaproteobacteria bacterium]